jgi:hypothetical protein
MTRRSGAIVALAVAGAFILGLAAGQQWEFRQFRDYESRRASGDLRFALDGLSLLEIGEPEKLKRVLEWQPLAGVHLGNGREWRDLDQAERESLLVAKAWFERFPPAHVPLSAADALAAVPDEPLDPEACSPATRVLLGKLAAIEQASGDTGPE